MITIKPNPAAFYLIDMDTTIPIAIMVMSTHIFVICKFVIIYNFFFFKDFYYATKGKHKGMTNKNS